jgi:hypothetical protein
MDNTVEDIVELEPDTRLVVEELGAVAPAPTVTVYTVPDIKIDDPLNIPPAPPPPDNPLPPEPPPATAT